MVQSRAVVSLVLTFSVGEAFLCIQGRADCPFTIGLRSSVALFISGFLYFQGKFIRINFDVTGYIVGANIETCILFHN